MSEVRVFDLLHAVAALVREDEDRSLPQLGLTSARAHVLWMLRTGGPSKQSEIAEGMRVTPRHVTTLVDELSDRGLVRRIAHPSDRRAVLVELTIDGTALTRRMQREHGDTEERLIDALPADHVDRFVSDLSLVVARLESLVAETRA